MSSEFDNWRYWCLPAGDNAVLSDEQRDELIALAQPTDRHSGYPDIGSVNYRWDGQEALVTWGPDWPELPAWAAQGMAQYEITYAEARALVRSEAWQPPEEAPA